MSDRTPQAGASLLQHITPASKLPGSQPSGPTSTSCCVWTISGGRCGSPSEPRWRSGRRGSPSALALANCPHGLGRPTLATFSSALG